MYPISSYQYFVCTEGIGQLNKNIMINIKFPDGSVRSFEKGVTGYEIAQSISPRLAAEVLAVSVKAADDTTMGKGTTYDLTHPIEEDSSVRLLKWDDRSEEHTSELQVTRSTRMPSS